jgi:hypothetical protein
MKQRGECAINSFFSQGWKKIPWIGMGEKKWGGVWKWTVVERGQNRINGNKKAGW